MRRVVVQQAGVGVSGMVQMDIAGAAMYATVDVDIDSGAIDATVEYTMENTMAGTPPDSRWHAHRYMTNKTGKAVGTFIGAVSAIRLRNAAAGTARMVLLQEADPV